MKRLLFLSVSAVLANVGPVAAETLTCSSTEAYRLEAAGMAGHPKDFYGLQSTSDLRVDMDAGTVSAGTQAIAALVLRSRPDPATGADLVFSSEDGSMLFRVRFLEGATPFLLVDTYDIYVGTCQR